VHHRVNGAIVNVTAQGSAKITDRAVMKAAKTAVTDLSERVRQPKDRPRETFRNGATDFESAPGAEMGDFTGEPTEH
jgi:hypothetical protein